MGNRATYYLRRQGELQVSSSKWGANSIDASLLCGPDAIRHHFDPPDGSYAYVDEIMCEAGYLVDVDLKRLHFFGGEWIGHLASLRPAFLGLLRLTWPGWDVGYAYDGILELGELCGGPKRGVSEHDLSLLEPYALADVLARSPLYHPSVCSGEDAVALTVASGGNVVDHLVPADDVASLLGLGPELPAMLGDRFRCDLPTEADDLLVRGSAVVEPERRRLTVWVAKPRLVDFAFVAQRWPGWEVARHDGGLPRHAELSGRDPATYRLPFEAAVAQVLAKLDDYRGFRKLPAVRELLRGVPEDDAAEAARLAEHLSRQPPARSP